MGPEADEHLRRRGRGAHAFGDHGRRGEAVLTPDAVHGHVEVGLELVHDALADGHLAADDVHAGRPEPPDLVLDLLGQVPVVG
ncbi:hypothetical protein DF186_21300, partial [Enterococcus hirae]